MLCTAEFHWNQLVHKTEKCDNTIQINWTLSKIFNLRFRAQKYVDEDVVQMKNTRIDQFWKSQKELRKKNVSVPQKQTNWQSVQNWPSSGKDVSGPGVNKKDGTREAERFLWNKYQKNCWWNLFRYSWTKLAIALVRRKLIYYITSSYRHHPKKSFNQSVLKDIIKNNLECYFLKQDVIYQ